ncbi:tyrosine--tRNA ligase [Spiroplasma endosymbiont of Labia minor]|uniref:tyrosine--tRNA ligase n=1 Tax=Spiroplasma endosymbiont of Labia minor TaxID=3066305 RepID=UPI0030CAEB3B
MNNALIDELTWRGLLKQVTNESKLKKAMSEKAGVYIGFDPTADSLHVGHLIPIINLRRITLFDLQPIAVMGGATGKIGDPSFKKDERKLLSDEIVEHNIQAIKKQLSFMLPNIKIINNSDWLSSMLMIDFLRDVGKEFNLTYLLAKESIASRISSGLSITEFFYTMLQAYDFYMLYENYKCWGQMGGSDQWGNITSGIDYISSQIGHENSNAFGLTMNLLTKKDGMKFGKTEAGTVWLDKNKTSYYDFYQFWFNQEDDDIEKLLKFFTFMNKEEIDAIITAHKKEPFKRIAQKELAKRVTLFVHGDNGLNEAVKITDAIFSGDILALDKDFISKIISTLIIGESKKNVNVVDLLVNSTIASSKRQSREWIQAKAISLNGIIVSEDYVISDKDIIVNDLILIKRGKRKIMSVKLTNN